MAPHPPLFSRDEASEEVPEALGDVHHRAAEGLDDLGSAVRTKRDEEDQEGDTSPGQKLLPRHDRFPLNSVSAILITHTQSASKLPKVESAYAILFVDDFQQAKKGHSG